LLVVVASLDATSKNGAILGKKPTLDVRGDFLRRLVGIHGDAGTFRPRVPKVRWRKLLGFLARQAGARPLPETTNRCSWIL
jgi:hypothetical protein